MRKLATAVVLGGMLVFAGAATLRADAVGREITISSLNNEKFLPAVAYNVDRQEFLVVWHNKWGGDFRDIYAARLDRFGRVLSTFTVATSSYNRAQPAVAYDHVRDRYLVVYLYDFNGDGSDWDVRGRLVPWNGPNPALAEFTIWDASDSQWGPRIEYNGVDDEYMVVWSNTPASGNASISARFVSASGTPDYAFTVAGGPSHNYVNPDLTFNQSRNEYLAAYEIDGVDVAAHRMNSGGLVGSEEIVAGWPDTEGQPVAAACPGQDQWLVVWRSLNPVATPYARFLFGTGGVDGPPLEVYATTGTNENPDVACLPGGASYMITWAEQYAGGRFGIGGRRLASTKVFLGDPFVIRPVYGGQTRDAESPTLIGGTIGWSTVWVQEREGSTYSDLHGAMVWGLFADDFETGNTSKWSSVVP